MITPDYILLMTRYNCWQNESLVGTADGLTAEARELDRGAYFGSILATFSHLLWGDEIWMARFDGGAVPGIGIADSPAFETDWLRFKERRVATDRRIGDWAEGLGDADGTLRWMSGALGREVERPLALCIAHFFNHQTHHRGQIHAILTAAGARPGDTDLFIMPGTG